MDLFCIAFVQVINIKTTVKFMYEIEINKQFDLEIVNPGIKSLFPLTKQSSLISESFFKFFIESLNLKRNYTQKISGDQAFHEHYMCTYSCK